MSLVYIQLQHGLPNCFWSSLKKARELWPGDIYLVAPQRESAYTTLLKKYNVKFVAEESFEDDLIIEYKKHTFLDRAGWDGFWDNTCKRFIYLYFLQKEYNIPEMIHLETDVVPYMDVSIMLNTFRKHYKNKIVFSLHAPYQLSCCFMYCNNIDLFGLFCNEIIQYFKKGEEHFKKIYPTQNIINETNFAYTFWYDNKENVGLFPTMPSDKPEIGFLIDPTAWGMWLDGLYWLLGEQYATDKHYVGAQIVNGTYDIHFSYKNMRIDQPFIYNKKTGQSYPLATLHFNSKRPEKWI